MEYRDPMQFKQLGMVAAILSVSAAHAQIVFTDDFTDPSKITSMANGYLGGWFGSQVPFEQWIGVVPADASISGGQLNVSSTTANVTRGAFVVLAPEAFSSAGTFTLDYDVSALALGKPVNEAVVRVWTGSGFDMTFRSANALIINPQTGMVTKDGSLTSVTLAASDVISSTGSAKLSFDRASNEAVAIFFGVTGDRSGGPWPIPTMSIGSMSVSVVPEPHHYAALTGLSLLGFALWRRTHRTPRA